MRLPTRASRLGLLLLVALLLLALGAPLISHFTGYGPYEPAVSGGRVPPTAPDGRHWLGTDALGRDLLARTLYGARISLGVGILAEGVALAIGLAVGGLAGLLGGRVDEILMRGADLLLALPAPLLALAIIAAAPAPESVPLLGLLPDPGLAQIFLVLGLVGWGGIARLVRGEILVLRELDFALSARAVGAGGGRLLARHFLPNALGPVMTLAVLGVAGNILAEAWLSFLGIGARPPLPSWGVMITEGQNYLTTHPWVCVYPGLALFMTVLGLNLLGDGLREAWDPRSEVAPARSREAK